MNNEPNVAIGPSSGGPPPQRGTILPTARKPTPRNATKQPQKAMPALPFGATNATTPETSSAMRDGIGGNSNASMRPNEKEISESLRIGRPNWNGTSCSQETVFSYRQRFA